MKQTFRKIKRVQPIIKLKKTRMDEEAAILNAIRTEKVEIVKAMKDSQKRYMDGVEELNRVRNSKARPNIETLEQALDYVKGQWYKLYKDVQEVEKREKNQLQQLIMAEQELKSVEKLKEKYETDFAAQNKRADQKIMDEAALRKYAGRD